MYAGLAILFFFLVIYLQQVAGYSALRSGLSTLPVTIVMFAFSRRFGMLADRLGPRLFMGFGPLVAAGGILLLLRVGWHVSYWTDLLPGLLVFSLGLSMTVAPLTATVLADADETRRRHRLRDQQRGRARRRARRHLGDRRRRREPADRRHVRRRTTPRSTRSTRRCVICAALVAAGG